MTSERHRVAVVGGGLGGLAAAGALHRRGIPARVYERGPYLREQGAGMHLGPNAARLLIRLGLGDALARIAVRPRAMRVCAAHDGRVLMEQEMGDSWEARFGAPYYTVHRGELHRLLASALPAGTVRTGRGLTAFRETPEGVRLFFADGGMAEADVLVGADGTHSVVRRALAGEDGAVPSGSAALRGLVDAADVPGLDPRLMYLFAGPRTRLLCFPVSGGRQFTYVAVVPGVSAGAESWTSAASPDDLAAALEGFVPVARRIAEVAREVRRWCLYDRAPLARWSTARTTLLGDAAHPMLPHHGQGANQAIEDAFALAAFLERAPAAEALAGYERLRRPHTTRVQLGSRGGGSLRETGEGSGQGLRPAVEEARWMQSHDVEAAVAAALPGVLAA